MYKAKKSSVVFECFLSGVVSFNIRLVEFVVCLGTELFCFFFYELSNIFYAHISCLNVVLQCPVTDGGMASKGLRAISYQDTRKVEADYNPPHTTETLIGYTACCAVVHYFNRFITVVLKSKSPISYFSILYC